MRQAAQVFVGTHDFKSFCSNKHMKKSTERTVYSIDISKSDSGEIRMLFHGKGFLYNMVRIMVGTLIEAGRGEITPEDIEHMIELKDREKAGATAPACGLTLLEVEY